MENKLYKDFFLTEEAYIKNKRKADGKIKTFKNRYMSNAKWKKLFLTVFQNGMVLTECEIVDFFGGTYRFIKNSGERTDYSDYIYSDCIDETLVTGEYAVSYREIAYLEWKKSNRDGKKIKEILAETGKYEWEETEAYLRIYGYT
ncbi:MAG: hypothetical protein LBD24_09665 [Spirochaetaceae bacterium]|jgi:hypothetical protein|nr:hypothetical protein [Spirochaetaceae bacterium]